MISVKDLTPNDIIGVLEEVAGLGYEGVEFARGFFSCSDVSAPSLQEPARVILRDPDNSLPGRRDPQLPLKEPSYTEKPGQRLHRPG